jgi:hypothetical protein
MIEIGEFARAARKRVAASDASPDRTPEASASPNVIRAGVLAP